MLTHAEFCQRLKELREERGFTQASFERAYGCGRNRCRRWEDGKKYPDEATVRSICRVLDVPYKTLQLPPLKKRAPTVFCIRLRALRKKTGMGSQELSCKLGYDPSCWADWEKGRHRPHRSAIECIATFFGLDADELLALRDGR